MAKTGAEGLWAADHELVYAHHDLFDRAHPGEEWQLEVSPGLRVPVIIKEPVVAEVVGNSVAGFLAEVALPDQREFIASSREYFIVHKTLAHSQPVATKGPPLGELSGWRPTPELRARIEQVVNARMKDELASMHRFAYRDENSDSKYPELKENFQKWRVFDQKLARGECKLDYDIQAFQLTPDAKPRLFIRARWTIDQEPAFLMTAWLRAQPDPVIETADAGHSELLRMFDGYAPDLGSLGTVLNVFDRNGNGNGELLMLKSGWEGFGISLLRYTETGPVPTKVSFGGSA